MKNLNYNKNNIIYNIYKKKKYKLLTIFKTF